MDRYALVKLRKSSENNSSVNIKLSKIEISKVI